MTYEEFSACFPNAIRDNLRLYYPLLSEVMDRYGITTKNQKAMFLAMISIESGDLTHTSENLNYSWKGLRQTFPKYFPTDTMAMEYSRKPIEIANHVYANRLDNGGPSSGDGWRFRGAGLIQLTGRYNHTKIAEEFGMDVQEASDWMRSPEGASECAGWFWKKKKLNPKSDVGDVKFVTKKITGGATMLVERTRAFNRNVRVIG